MAVRTYYEILGVAPDADENEIRRAYRRAMREHHPDQNPDDPKAAKRSRELNAARETLLDPENHANFKSGQTVRIKNVALLNIMLIGFDTGT